MRYRLDQIKDYLLENPRYIIEFCLVVLSIIYLVQLESYNQELYSSYGDYQRTIEQSLKIIHHNGEASIWQLILGGAVVIAIVVMTFYLFKALRDKQHTNELIDFAVLGITTVMNAVLVVVIISALASPIIIAAFIVAISSSVLIYAIAS